MAKNNLNNYTDANGLGFPKNFKRGNPNPLDNSEVWNTLDNAQSYATSNSVAYVGQKLSVIADTDTTKNGVYIIVDEKGTLKKLATTDDIGGSTGGDPSIGGDSISGTLTSDYIKFVAENLVEITVDDTKYYALEFNKNDTVLGVFKNGYEIGVQFQYEDDALYIIVGDTIEEGVEYYVRKLSGSGVSGGGGGVLTEEQYNQLISIGQRVSAIEGETVPKLQSGLTSLDMRMTTQQSTLTNTSKTARNNASKIKDLEDVSTELRTQITGLAGEGVDGFISEDKVNKKLSDAFSAENDTMFTNAWLKKIGWSADVNGYFDVKFANWTLRILWGRVYFNNDPHTDVTFHNGGFKNLYTVSATLEQYQTSDGNDKIHTYYGSAIYATTNTGFRFLKSDDGDLANYHAYVRYIAIGEV